ncbi:hypothetical protein BCR44DRAFT_33983 [Catenaria anguillulae PL171]|uniref:Uncharacterized protein n=1 Tax=Catenaria anguillulae PL171 TaxID=765915 RepID=A0A1Y2HYG0_9FUNG|nr:hypothetical protein BCR44DRAFT_33983 [Catenaria anguillulae PL171]
MLCDEMLVDLGPGAELEAIFAPSAAETSSGVAVPSFAPTRHTRQPPSQLQMATNEQDAMQVDPDPSSSNDAAHREQIDPQKWATDFLLSVFEADALAVMGQGKQGVLTAPPSPTVGAAGQLGQGEAAGADKAGVEERVEDELMAMLVD